MPLETILVVEDEAVTALDIQQSLRQRGFNVPETAATGEEAIALVRKFNPDLVLIDIRLAGNIDGIQAAKLIRREFNLPIVFLTAFADAATLQRAKAAEPCAYLLKPFDDTVLSTTIEIAVNKHRAQETLVRQAAEALEASEDRFRALAENIADHGVQLLDESGRLLSWNPGSERMHGWEAAEILGKDIAMLYSEEEVAAGKPCQDLQTAAARGRLHEYGCQTRKDGSSFSAEIILIALRNQHGRHTGFLRVTRAIPHGNGNGN
jgi:PAS domain S-box-containing protein